MSTCWLITAKALTSLVIPRYRGNLSLQGTFTYIPGPTFRGALAYALADQAHEKGLDSKTTFEAFQGEPLKVTPLLPSPGSGQSCGIPIPLSARKCKFDTKHPSLDLLAKNNVAGIRCLTQVGGTACNGPFEPMEMDFMEAETTRFSPFSLETLATTHNEIRDNTGFTKKGILFSLEKIEEGQVFTGGVCFKDRSQENQLWSLVSNDLNAKESDWILGIGQGTTRGRGLVRITAQRLDNWSDIITLLNNSRLEDRLAKWRPEWRKVQLPEKISIPLTLLSDTILLQPDLSYGTGITGMTLAETLNLSGLQIDLEKAFTRTVVVGGWNREHGRMKLHEQALAMGSTFLFSINTNGILKDDLLMSLKKLEQEGMGIRRQEGYGRLIVAHPFHLQPQWMAFPQRAQSVSPQSQIGMGEIFQLLTSHINQAAYQFMDDDFNPQKEENQIILIECFSEINHWLEAASSWRKEFNPTQLQNRIAEIKNNLKSVFSKSKEGWERQDVFPSVWLVQRLSIDWGLYLLQQACMLLNQTLNNFRATVEITEQTGKYFIILRAPGGKKEIELSERWIRQGILDYFYQVRDRGRILSL